MEALTSPQTIHRPQILYALPISAESFLLGFEAHSFWFPRMQTFRLCMQQRTTNSHRLTLSEKLIRTVEKYVRAAGNEHGIQYSRNFFRRVKVAQAKVAAELQARKLRASWNPLSIAEAIIEDHKEPGEEDWPCLKGQDVPGLVQNYIAAVFNLAIIPSRQGGRTDLNQLYLCFPWWPAPRWNLDLQRWYDEKSARPEMSDLFAYFGWDAGLSAEVVPADDVRAVGPSREDVLRLNDAICTLNIEVVVSGWRDAEVRTSEERGDGKEVEGIVDEREGEERWDGRGVEGVVKRVAAQGEVTHGDITVGYVKDSTTGKKLWQPKRLLYLPVETY